MCVELLKVGVVSWVVWVIIDLVAIVFESLDGVFKVAKGLKNCFILGILGATYDGRNYKDFVCFFALVYIDFTGLGVIWLRSGDPT